MRHIVKRSSMTKPGLNGRKQPPSSLRPEFKRGWGSEMKTDSKTIKKTLGECMKTQKDFKQWLSINDAEKALTERRKLGSLVIESIDDEKVSINTLLSYSSPTDKPQQMLTTSIVSNYYLKFGLDTIQGFSISCWMLLWYIQISSSILEMWFRDEQ